MTERGQSSHTPHCNKCKPKTESFSVPNAKNGGKTVRDRDRGERDDSPGKGGAWVKSNSICIVGGPDSPPWRARCSHGLLNKQTHPLPKPQHHTPARSGDVINYHQNEHDSKQVCVPVCVQREGDVGSEKERDHCPFWNKEISTEAL